MNVLVLGAGASKSYALSPTGQRMPIARDFFPTFSKLAILNNPWVLRGYTTSFAWKYLGLHPDLLFQQSIDVEEFHSKVEAVLLDSLSGGRASSEDRTRSWKAFHEMIFLFATTLNEIQNGPLSPPHAGLAGYLNSEDVVITYNWDTLIDRALNETTPWRTDSGYGLQPRAIFRDGWVPPIGTKSKSPVLLKLHGSTNWLTSAPHLDPHDTQTRLTQTASAETVYVFEQSEHPYDCYQGRFMGGYSPFAYGYYPPNIKDDPGKSAGKGRVFLRVTPQFAGVPKGGAGRDGLLSMPLIIPPVKEKKYDLFGTLFSDLWKKAEAALAEADQITIIGYSFPQTDYRSNLLFRNAFMRRSSVPVVNILNPEPQRLIEKFRLDFGIPENRLNIFAERFDEHFDLAKLNCFTSK